MASMAPTLADNKTDLWRKIANNYYIYALGQGATGLNTPSWNDKAYDLEKKVAYATAAAVDA